MGLMNRQRAFVLTNLSLAAASCFFIYYLVFQSDLEDSAELREAELWLEALEHLDAASGGEEPTTFSEEYPALVSPRNIARALFTQTPTPIPTPPPTPTPVPLGAIIGSWAVVSMDEASVIVLDQKTGLEVELQLDGGPFKASFQGQEAMVRLTRINFEEGYAEFSGNGETVRKPF
jgi:hypothetical protein